ncbi:hypothetical protein BKA67DRAFT_587157 [Truncatella angustata]|uniref:Uncharacterized protein n=1 Tax=Truncatella angustata TaxID=152316 RepID=A0A9P8RFR9_9PEZI|nr:uncharacterized protein BKA67DRAFT_587157 [Truncatella angustata]KAH6645198.1 hypothetical protein BKA67DRAFT_587157 [Truncatella angustata]
MPLLIWLPKWLTTSSGTLKAIASDMEAQMQDYTSNAEKVICNGSALYSFMRHFLKNQQEYDLSSERRPMNSL